MRPADVDRAASAPRPAGNEGSEHGADAARRARGADLAAALIDARRETLALFAAYEAALGAALRVPYRPGINPPLWELGHVGWFQERWIGRNRHRALGARADPDAPRGAPARDGADARFDSARVPHRHRWTLPLPESAALREDLRRGLETTLARLDESGPGDDESYFFRLVLFHEDMHREAAVYMAQQLDLPLAGFAPKAAAGAGPIRVPGGAATFGAPAGGFAFDNELGRLGFDHGSFEIDAAPLDWRGFVPFVEAGGYSNPAYWTDAGREWLREAAATAPRMLRTAGSGWQRLAFGRWIDLDPDLPAMHLCAHEAEAWCAWAGRRLPTEFEWQLAAERAGGAFHWGQVWEWTSSPFLPFPGFEPHPYRDYSAPFFGRCRTLRGGSFATRDRMKHPRYRNFFPPERNDIVAGFRTCAIS